MLQVQRSPSYRNFLLILILIPLHVGGQGFEADSADTKSKDTETFMFQPIASVGIGVLNFYGDVSSSLNSPSIGYYAGYVNLAAFLDPHRYFLANFMAMRGTMGGNAYSTSDLTGNLNFETSLTSFGFTVEYRFGHLFREDALVQPYISLGVESINFSAKGDLTDVNGMTYHYWSDGTIRDLEEGTADPGAAAVLHRDFTYETDLRLRDQLEFGLGDYNQRSLAFPAEVGLHFRIDRRASFSAGVSYHYTLTDMLDNVAYEGTSVRGYKGNDSYLFTHVAFHYNLVRPRASEEDLYLDEGAYDPIMYEDNDGDGIRDWVDLCQGTPSGVVVDTSGCPLDGDRDGVPDYMDVEQDTRPGAWVDPDGMTVSEEEFQSRLAYRDRAMKREEVAAYMDMVLAIYTTGEPVEIPEKFKPLDTDLDGYLSYEELLFAIDRYFDYQLDLSLDELRDLNEFFFSQ